MNDKIIDYIEVPVRKVIDAQWCD